MKIRQFFLFTSLILSVWAFAQDNSNAGKNASMKRAAQPSSTCRNCLEPHGWSFDVGGQYTWMSFTTPPSFTGSTGGVHGKITFQEAWSFFGQLRTIYNIGPLSSSVRKSSDNEWYTEFVSGYCFCVYPHWTVTPYAGVGLDFFNDYKKGYAAIAPIDLHYRSYYALFGFDTRYSWYDWYFGLQADCLPVFHQYLSVGGEEGAAWKMKQRVGVAVRLPVGHMFDKGISVELTPYYRLLPFGKSSELVLPERTLNQWGAFVTLRYTL